MDITFIYFIAYIINGFGIWSMKRACGDVIQGTATMCLVILLWPLYMGVDIVYASMNAVIDLYREMITLKRKL